MATKKRAKKRLPKPVPCERWGVFDPCGNFVMDVHNEETASSCTGKNGGWSYCAVRIVPVVANRRKGAK